jgi:hypothetical protein
MNNTKKSGDYSPGPFKLGVSMSASWAWGVSLGVSFSILKTKGLLPFVIWGTYNILAITIYGLYIKKLPNYLQFRKNRIIKTTMLIVQVFAIWINIKIMYDFIGNPYIATTIALLVIALTLKYKFKFSLESDKWQYLIMVIGLAAVVLTGNFDLKNVTVGNNISWALWGGICLLTGPFLDGQQFQRANKAKSIKPFLIGSLTFAIYLSLVFLAYFSNRESLLLTIIVIAVATSTIDSSVASLQYLTNENIAGFISIFALLTWTLFMTNTAAEIWSWYGSGRVFIVIPMIILGVYYEKNKKRRISDDSREQII